MKQKPEYKLTLLAFFVSDSPLPLDDDGSTPVVFDLVVVVVNDVDHCPLFRRRRRRRLAGKDAGLQLHVPATHGSAGGDDLAGSGLHFRSPLNERSVRCDPTSRTIEINVLHW